MFKVLSDNIRSYRKKSNMSQDELAEKLGVSRQSVSLWENGQTQPTVDNIIAMTKIFNISFDMLLDGSAEDGRIAADAPNGVTGSAETCPNGNDCPMEGANEFSDDASAVEPAAEDDLAERKPSDNMKRLAAFFGEHRRMLLVVLCAAVIIIAAVTAMLVLGGRNSHDGAESSDSSAEAVLDDTTVTTEQSDTESESTETPSATIPEVAESTEDEGSAESEPVETQTEPSAYLPETEPSEVPAAPTYTEAPSKSPAAEAPAPAETTAPQTVAAPVTSSAPTVAPFDLFEYCKAFAIENGELNGDYSMYSALATTYGGYENEYFSLAYWADSDMVEFCLHCPLDELLSINFYLRMRGSFDGRYEYCVSKYYRANGESLRCATGYIDPTVFAASYPISCDDYIGDTTGQSDFMEESRVGICDLIGLIKTFADTACEGCDFSAFGFVNF